MQAGNYLTGYAHGGYGDLKDLPQRLEAYAREHRIKCIGPVYHVYPLNEVSVKDPEDYLMRLSIRVQ